MDILYLLIPLSVILVMAILAMLAWALSAGQFDDLEHQGELIFDPEEARARALARKTPGAPHEPTLRDDVNDNSKLTQRNIS